jgi:hypothetical protein
MAHRTWTWTALVALTGCVPPGSAGEQDAGKASPAATAAPRAAPTFTPSPDVMKTPFEDDFERSGNAPAPSAAPSTATSDSSAPSASPSGSASAAPTIPGGDLGPDWMATSPGIWHLEKGRLCGEHAKNHGVWLKRTLPVNARIEFDAVGDSADGDVKAEYWGDGRSYATALSYTNATSYLTIFGGWHNKYHVLARINEHATDRPQITVTPDSDDPREHAVVAGQLYHFKVERTDGKTIKWWVDGNEMLSMNDPNPLLGTGHDHFGFNDWDVKVCFDNVKVVPLPAR